MIPWSRSAFRSPNSSPRCGRSCAPDPSGVADAALAVLLFTVGAQTPLLALLSLRRPRNLAAVVLPYGTLIPLALAIGALAPGLTGGALALAVSPAELAAPALARALGGRMETAAALVAGSIVVSLALLAAASAGIVSAATFAFAVGVAVGGSLPTLRDALLPLIRGASNVALAVLAVVAIARALPAANATAVIAALVMLLAGIATAALVAFFLGGDWRAFAVGGGTRDFAIAATLAAVHDASAAVLPVIYGGVLFAVVGAATIVRRARLSG